MMFSAIDVAALEQLHDAIESLVVGKGLLLALICLSVVFVSCFVMGIVSIGRSRKIVKTKDDYDDLMHKMASLSSQRDALVAEIQSRGTEREEYARATKFLEMQPHLVAEVGKLEKAIADKELTLKKLYDQLQDAEKKYEELKKISNEIMEMERDKTILDGERKEAERSRDDMRKKADEESKRVDALKREGKNLSDEIAKSQAKKEDLERSVKQLTQRQDEARAWLDENKDKLRDRDDLDRQIADAKDELKRLDEKVKDGTKAVADTMDRIDKGLDRLNKMNLSGVQTLRQNAFVSLKEGVFSIPGQTAHANEDEQEALATVADHMEKSKFVVPERLLYAFHTSLKTSDMSSLTVMAGVCPQRKNSYSFSIFFRNTVNTGKIIVYFYFVTHYSHIPLFLLKILGNFRFHLYFLLFICYNSNTK